MVFVESLKTRAQMERLAAELGPKVPLLHNLLRADDEVREAATVQQIGYNVALFPGAAVSAVGQALDDAFAGLMARPEITANGPASDRIGAAEYLAQFKPE